MRWLVTLAVVVVVVAPAWAKKKPGKKAPVPVVVDQRIEVGVHFARPNRAMPFPVTADRPAPARLGVGKRLANAILAYTEACAKDGPDCTKARGAVIHDLQQLAADKRTPLCDLYLSYLLEEAAEIDPATGVQLLDPAIAAARRCSDAAADDGVKANCLARTGDLLMRTMDSKMASERYGAALAIASGDLHDFLALELGENEWGVDWARMRSFAALVTQGPQLAAALTMDAQAAYRMLDCEAVWRDAAALRALPVNEETADDLNYVTSMSVACAADPASDPDGTARWAAIDPAGAAAVTPDDLQRERRWLDRVPADPAGRVVALVQKCLKEMNGGYAKGDPIRVVLDGTTRAAVLSANVYDVRTLERCVNLRLAAIIPAADERPLRGTIVFAAN